ncbi:uncharacterized protein L969DRAFT_413647 [Mixia osmundae IAM 14324]|uniref:Pre-mRNA-processing factor 17 n=1 Tax=Mixia osmundae (strain CBS 9802 / IAM 14324 / JCM 22182 / KY 12970) TaxID=764103 RepID=G7E915_MIXOS|nr:uncharacterized protein L969DRAFT_413647 [Mixia osmundae IAM 14324]KEI40269.1 hypothetical protein L969DRAFT_413647 [Mixia osmundae IAM 14324]GAA99633.1 hypothetical protein E5Q_06334 [Mixia osmundae IAM 14324]
MAGLVEYADSDEEASAKTASRPQDRPVAASTIQPAAGDDSDEEEDANPLAFTGTDAPRRPQPTASVRRLGSSKISAAPDVLDQDIMTAGSTSLVTRPTDNQMNINLTYQDMLAPVAGPLPIGGEKSFDRMNMLTGHVEQQAMSDLDFKVQERAYQSLGYARNPSELNSAQQPFVGDLIAAQNVKDVSFDTFRPSAAMRQEMKKKRKNKGVLGEFDPEGEEIAEEDRVEYVGPWAAYREERLDIPAGPDEEEYESSARRGDKRAILERSAREVGFGEEKSVFHGAAMRDYQGRTYMATPRDIDTDLEPSEPGTQQCYIPKSCIHTWSGHTKGVSCIRLFPKTGHLILSGSMDSRVKLWDVYHEGKCLRTFMGHGKAVRDVAFNNDGTRFLSAGYDRQIKLWDTETGQCLQAFTNTKIPYVVKFNPDPAQQNVFLAGMSDKKIIQYDLTSEKITQEYDQHLGPVNTITWVDENRRFVTTSDDKTIRAWDYDIPVVIKYIAEPSMHSMPAVTLHPDKKYMAMQSLDNQILVWTTEFKQNRKKRFAGHITGGYACEIAFSPDGKWLSSGDGSGNLHFWDWKTCKKMPQRIKAHNHVVISHAWLPHETSKVVTGSWDGNIKLWD